MSSVSTCPGLQPIQVPPECLLNKGVFPSPAVGMGVCGKSVYSLHSEKHGGHRRGRREGRMGEAFFNF